MLMHRTASLVLAVVGLAIVAVGPSQARAANLTTLYSFCSVGAAPNCADGWDPQAGLIADAKGNLFGTTRRGGTGRHHPNGLANDGGTVFEIAKTASGYASTVTTLIDFCSLPNCADGGEPQAGPLLADAKGNLFGTTNLGGTGLNIGGPFVGGTVFEVVKTASGYASAPTILYSFCSLADCADGAGPVPGVIADAKGNLFGTTSSGGAGAGGGGTAFEIVKTHRGYASTVTTLVDFCSLANCADGESPTGILIADAKGNLFGTTSSGGTAIFSSLGGTVFEIPKTADGYASAPIILANFCSLPNCADGARPFAGLIADAKGNLFGTTSSGGAHGQGTVFEIVKTASGYASTVTTLVDFCSLPNCADGAEPLAPLIFDAKGNLFGTTALGGTGNNGGTVFEIAKTQGGYASTPTILYSFCSLPNCADGVTPLAGLMADAKGNLFSTTALGGTGNNGGTDFSGTVFEVTDTGFVIFAGTPGKPNCFGQSVSALARQYGGLNAAADALGFPSVHALQEAIRDFCEG
jgi:uncharacterized repeat protein (TIGR03803 family)